MSTAGAQASGLAPLSYCWPVRQPRTLAVRSISSCAARMSSNRSQPVMLFSLASGRVSGPATRKNTAQVNTIQFRATLFTVQCTVFTVKCGQEERAMASQENARESAATRPLWFAPPDGDDNRRRTLTRDRVIAEALAVISADGAAALSMRTLAARLGVVPGAL